MAGLYAANGTLNVTVVNGSSLTGLYAADGSLNVVKDAGSSYVGSRHPCGALYIKKYTTSAPCPLLNANGSINVTETASNLSGALRVTAVSGSL